MIAGFAPGCIKNAEDLAEALELVILDLFKGSVHTFSRRDNTLLVTVDADDVEEPELVIWIGTEAELKGEPPRRDQPSAN
jgi:hypothetical protein